MAGAGLRPAGLGWSCLCSHRSHDWGETDSCRSGSGWGQRCPPPLPPTEQDSPVSRVLSRARTRHAPSFSRSSGRPGAEQRPGRHLFPARGVRSPPLQTHQQHGAPGRGARCRGTREYSSLLMLFLKLNFMFFPQLAYITFRIIKQHNFLNSFIRRRLATLLRFNL